MTNSSSKRHSELNPTLSQAEALFREGWRLLDAGDDRRGARALLESARLGHVEAQQGVGYLFDVGKGVRRSVETAFKWYKIAARAGDAAAAANIGTLYKEQNKRTVAMRWFERALRLGIPDVLLEIAQLRDSTSCGRKSARADLRRLLRRKDVIQATREEAEALLRTLVRPSNIKQHRKQ